jgi:hypothetical protein
MKGETRVLNDQQLVDAENHRGAKSNALPSNRTEQIITNFANKLADSTIKIVEKALARKDEETRVLKNQIRDLDYLLNSGRNTYKQQKEKDRKA